jgi:DNA gyrase inhibitor GyrI
MNKLEVRIVKLEPLRVAYTLGFGTSPEGQAWDQLTAWAKQKGLLKNLSAHRLFGFNNPDPHPGSPNYGYEQWMTVGPEVESQGDVDIKEFSGGLYAVTRCKGVSAIPTTWKQLVAWYEDSPYQRAHHQWLEECLNPQVNMLPPSGVEPDYEQLVFDLYLPIAR